MKKKTIIIKLCCVFILTSCLGLKGGMNRSENMYLNEYIGYLSKSFDFLENKKQQHFKDSIISFMKSCKDYNYFDGIMEPIICQPVLVNKSENKSIIPILERSLDLGKNKVDRVTYILGKFEDGKWKFKREKVISESFSYVNNFPRLSDTEIGVKIIRNLLLRNDIGVGGDVERIFNSDFYTF